MYTSSYVIPRGSGSDRHSGLSQVVRVGARILSCARWSFFVLESVYKAVVQLCLITHLMLTPTPDTRLSPRPHTHTYRQCNNILGDEIVVTTVTMGETVTTKPVAKKDHKLRNISMCAAVGGCGCLCRSLSWSARTAKSPQDYRSWYDAEVQETARRLAGKGGWESGLRVGDETLHPRRACYLPTTPAWFNNNSRPVLVSNICACVLACVTEWHRGRRQVQSNAKTQKKKKTRECQ